MKITYFEEDGLVYWTMGDTIEKTTIINRCPKEGTYEYRLKEGNFARDRYKTVSGIIFFRQTLVIWSGIRPFQNFELMSLDNLKRKSSRFMN